eukprot:9427733-Pyramimonas_sp.AAC.1
MAGTSKYAFPSLSLCTSGRNRPPRQKSARVGYDQRDESYHIYVRTSLARLVILYGNNTVQGARRRSGSTQKCSKVGVVAPGAGGLESISQLLGWFKRPVKALVQHVTI